VGTGWQLALIAALVATNAVLAGSEVALVSLREGQVRRIARRGGAGQVVAQLARDPNRYLATTQIGITLAGFLASATAAVSLTEPLVAGLRPLGAAARPVAVVAVTTILSLVTLVWGELAPKRLAMQHAVRWSLLVARPVSALAALVRPVVWLLGAATDATIWVLGGDPTRRRARITEEEIGELVAAEGIYTTAERQVIAGALEATHRTLRQVARPRPWIVALQDRTPVDDAVRTLVRTGHTRAPVYRERLDDADRTVALLDLVGRAGTVGAHASAAVVLPESMALVDALRALQAERQELALVVSEHGGVDGLITVEDLVEELVGDIRDRDDAGVRDVVRHRDGSLTLAGHFPMHDLVDLDVDLPAGTYVTLAGLVLDRLGRLPAVGDQIELAGWRITVTAVDGNAITWLHLAPATSTRTDRDA
jgi:putative hemolysin